MEAEECVAQSACISYSLSTFRRHFMDLISLDHRTVDVASDRLIALIAVISGLTCKRGERVNTALY